MDFLLYRETGHIGGPSGKGHIRALDIGNTPISGNITCMEIAYVLLILLTKSTNFLLSPRKYCYFVMHVNFQWNHQNGTILFSLCPSMQYGVLSGGILSVYMYLLDHMLACLVNDDVVLFHVLDSSLHEWAIDDSRRGCSSPTTLFPVCVQVSMLFPYEPCHKKPTFCNSDQVRHKSGCRASDDGWKLEISDLRRRAIALFAKGKERPIVIFVFAILKSPYSCDGT